MLPLLLSARRRERRFVSGTHQPFRCKSHRNTDKRGVCQVPACAARGSRQPSKCCCGFLLKNCIATPAAWWQFTIFSSIYHQRYSV